MQLVALWGWIALGQTAWNLKAGIRVYKGANVGGRVTETKHILYRAKPKLCIFSRMSMARFGQIISKLTYYIMKVSGVPSFILRKKCLFRSSNLFSWISKIISWISTYLFTYIKWTQDQSFWFSQSLKPMPNNIQRAWTKKVTKGFIMIMQKYHFLVNNSFLELIGWAL